MALCQTHQFLAKSCKNKNVLCCLWPVFPAVDASDGSSVLCLGLRFWSSDISVTFIPCPSAAGSNSGLAMTVSLAAVETRLSEAPGHPTVCRHVEAAGRLLDWVCKLCSAVGLRQLDWVAEWRIGTGSGCQGILTSSTNSNRLMVQDYRQLSQ